MDVACVLAGQRERRSRFVHSAKFFEQRAAHEMNVRVAARVGSAVAVEQGQSSGGPVGASDRKGPIHADGRSQSKGLEQRVERCDLAPIGVFWRARAAVDG